MKVEREIMLRTVVRASAAAVIVAIALTHLGGEMVLWRAILLGAAVGVFFASDVREGR